jgi:hypothetical protein
MALLCVVGCEGALTVTGVVRDQSARPIAGAAIALHDRTGAPSFYDTTDVSGCFRISHMVAPGRYAFNLKATMPGYRVAHSQVRTLEENRVEIILVPLDSTGESRVEFVDTVRCGG